MSKISSKQTIILASGSQTRRKMLTQVGLEFSAVSSGVDEELIKSNFTASLDELGLELARAKAREISDKNPKAIVIAADQLCIFAGQIFDKPGDHETCIKHLKSLRGQVHEQQCSAVIWRDSQELWSFQGSAKITMRNLSDEEITNYVTLEQPYYSCGSYMLEKHGKHLFQKIEGDHDVILGLPLVEILAKLYELKAIMVLGKGFEPSTA